MIGLIIGLMIAIPIIWSYKLLKEPDFQLNIDELSIEDIDEMNGYEFENILKPLFETQGYKANITKGSGDYGADLVLSKNGERTVVQAKCYKSNIGVTAVQQIVAAIKYYNADDAIVVSNQFFTKQAKRLASINNVKLIDRVEIQELILKYNREVKRRSSI
ncbi:restriction endonuclease [Evansella cellulosilytica]|uniref:Restriction endonuclease n=1 Tax=Evansella cellulosilytica (strain ATCC 21833 / DSM 2522 / FERM P-1141 / JCM 9156 / N-4) TaxID=649639 RepID=E6TVE8_EVAC2|nr:restriction endonuclease [Evansella cellulosilytica]ADU30965.1 restriction endonuclease [Evansella cellulosilytica DSM 2522]